MARSAGKVKLADKLGPKAAKAYESHKNDEINYGGGADLPDGIEGGVAQLVECKFDEYKDGAMKGKLYFLAAGIVVQPVTHNGIHIQGLRTQIGPEPLCETPTRGRKTLDEHIEWVQNELKKLGADLSETTLDDLDSVVEALKEEQPYFRFRTWKGKATKQYPDPRVNHQWRGACEYDGEAAADDVVEDEEAAEEPEDEAVAEEEAGEEDLTALAEAADNGDDEAQAKLEKLAEAQGIDATEIATWAEVAAMLEDGSEGGSDAEPEEEGEAQAPPEKGEVWYYKPPKARKLVECEVTAVFASKEVVNLKNLDDGKTIYKSVPWSALSDS